MRYVYPILNDYAPSYNTSKFEELHALSLEKAGVIALVHKPFGKIYCMFKV